MDKSEFSDKETADIAKSKARKSVEAEKARKAVATLKARARKLREDMKEVKGKTSASPPKRTGRVMDKGKVDAMSAPLKDIVKDNIVFSPNEGPQTDFLAAPERDVLYGGAAGGGKSYAMIIDPLRFAHIKDHRALILRKSMPELRELIDKTRELYPQAFPGCKYREVEKMWSFPSGAKVEFGFLERDSDVYRYQGQAYSWIGFDEITHLATEFPWTYLASRLRTTNQDITTYMRCTANPGGPGHAWVKQRYIEPAENNTSFVGEDGITRKFIPACLFDNPYLTRDGNYESMLKSLPEVHRRRLLEGDWDINEGSAFPEFDREHHVVEPFDIPADWARMKGVDYGYTAPAACVWGAIHPETGCIFIYKELYERGLTADDLKIRMTEMEIGEYRGIPGVLDGAVWNRMGYTGPTIGETLVSGAWGHKLRPADKNRKAGKVQVHEYLKDDPKTECPRLLIFSTCHNTIRELTTIPVSKTDSEDVDTHCDDHAYDALRYLLMSRPRKQSMSSLAQDFKRQAGYSPADSDFGY